MPLNQTQHTYLSAMGINLWQRKVCKNKLKPQDNSQALSQEKAVAATELTELSQSQLFVDILQSVNVSLGDITQHNNCLNLGWLNWEIHEGNELSFSNNTLRTPKLAIIAQSNTMKIALWQLLFNQNT